MHYLPKALEQSVAEFNKLPGVGRRSAERMAMALLTGREEQTQALRDALQRLRTDVGICPHCGYFTEGGECTLCTDSSRDGSLLCVVERPMDVIAFERAGGFRGLYHVLGGVLSPLKGVTPDDLAIDALVRRASKGEVHEIILATSPSVEGDATSLFLAEELGGIAGLSLTRIGRGVPMGGTLDLADGGTLRLALEGRRSYHNDGHPSGAF